ncbi:MAG: nucleotidyltransferase domain-containing protein [Actinobacteria bacterium]|nr:nucleotidyltransferase domain-containing protein [Actinomycetota bacterium]
MKEISLEKVKEVNENIISEVVRRILGVVNPEKVILFGSYAYGKPTKDSDLDILIIMDSKLPRYKRSSLIYKALAGILIPKDIIVYTPKEVEEWSDVPQAFVTTAVTKGKVIYEKSKMEG